MWGVTRGWGWDAWRSRGAVGLQSEVSLDFYKLNKGGWNGYGRGQIFRKQKWI